MPKKKTVLISGRSDAAYRGCFIVQYFQNRPETYSLLVLDSDAYDNLRPRFLRKVFSCISILISVLACDIILILPMHHGVKSSALIYRCAKWLNKRVITDFYLSIYETKVIDRKLYGPDSRAGLKNLLKDKRAIEGSQTLIFLNEAERDYYLEVVGCLSSTSKSKVRPLVSPLRVQAMLPYLSGAAPIPTIAWWGRMGNPLHGFEVIAEAIRILVDDGFEASFAIFGANDAGFNESVERFKDIAALPNVLFTHEYSFSNGKLEEFLVNEADLALGTFGITQKAKVVLTNKVVDAASFGIPCLTQHSEGLLQYFKPEESILLSEISPARLAARIQEVFTDVPRLRDVGIHARETVRKSFSKDSFETFIDELMQE